MVQKLTVISAEYCLKNYSVFFLDELSASSGPSSGIIFFKKRAWCVFKFQTFSYLCEWSSFTEVVYSA